MEKAVRTPYLSAEGINLIFSAHDIAQEHGSWLTDTVHLLRASLENRSITRILVDQQVDLAAMNYGLNEFDPNPSFKPPSIAQIKNKRPLTHSFMRVLHDSISEAEGNSSQQITMLDIFAALVKQKEGMAAAVLRDCAQIEGEKEVQILAAIQERRNLNASFSISPN